MDISTRIEILKDQLSKPRAQRRPPIGGKWTAEEDDQLRRVVSIHGAKNWKKAIVIPWIMCNLNLIFHILCSDCRGARFHPKRRAMSTQME